MMYFKIQQEKIMTVKKTWRERTQISIGELEDLFLDNSKLPIARCYLSGLKDFEMPLKEKVEFIKNVLKLRNEGSGFDFQKELTYLEMPAVEAFLELVPEWNDNFVDCGRRIIWVLSSQRFVAGQSNGSQAKVKKFLRSYLNSVKKEEMDESFIIKALVINGMLEELINYNFTSIEAFKYLWDYLFCRALYPNTTDKKESYFDLFMSFSTNKKESRQRARELFLSWDRWDTSKDRHALAVLHAILTKGSELGELKEILLGEEKSE